MSVLEQELWALAELLNIPMWQARKESIRDLLTWGAWLGRHKARTRKQPASYINQVFKMWAANAKHAKGRRRGNPRQPHPFPRRQDPKLHGPAAQRPP